MTNKALKVLVFLIMLGVPFLISEWACVTEANCEISPTVKVKKVIVEEYSEEVVEVQVELDNTPALPQILEYITPVQHPETLSNLCSDFIKDVEGFREKAYRDGAGNTTIGFGFTRHVLPNIRQYSKMSEREATDILKFLIDFKYIPLINEHVEEPLDDGTIVAMVSFIHNVGETAFINSTLLDKLNSGDSLSVAKELNKWIYIKGRKSTGLSSRRDKEIALILENKS